MSLTNETVSEKYTGDGANTTFPITFDIILNDSEVKVILRDETDPDNITETLQVDGVDYNLTGSSPPSIPFSTDVEMVVAPTSDQELIVYRQSARTQLLDYLENSDFRAESQEKGLDKLTALVQELIEELSRTPGLSIGTDANLPVSYPEPKANNFVGWDDEGDDLRNYTAAEIVEEVIGLVLLKANNLSDVADVPTSATNLGLGAADSVTHNDITLVATVSAGGAISTTSGNISTASGDMSASGKLTSGAEVEFETFLNTATIATPANPAAGRFKLYMKADGNLYKLDEFGAENVVAGSNTFTDDLFRIQDDGDNTKEIAFQASGITTATTRTITMPDADVNLGDIATNNAKVSFPEAPNDGSQYARKDLGWEIVAPGGDLWSDPVDSNIVPDGAGTRGIGDFTNHMGTIIGKNIWAKDTSPYMNFIDLSNQTFGRIRGKLTSITALSDTFGMQAESTGSAGATALSLSTTGSGTANADPSLPVLIETGNRTGGTGNSGDIRATIGTSLGGSQGEFKFLKAGTPPTVGFVWQCTNVDGSGYWAAPAGGGADTDLGNLTATAINQDLDPDTNNTRAMGGLANIWSVIHANIFRAVGSGNQFTLMNAAAGIFGRFSSAAALPSGVSNFTAVFAGLKGITNGLGLYSSSDSVADANSTGDVRRETGNKTAGTGNSGNIIDQTGTSAGGARGKIVKLDGSEGTPGNVWTEGSVAGEGSWQPAAVGGGAGGLKWQELGSSPVASNEFFSENFLYQSGISQDLYTQIEVPPGYIATNPIAMRINWYSPDTSGTGLIRAEATLIRPGTDAFNSTTNQRTTTNAAVSLTVANNLNTETLDLTSAGGLINAVGVSSGDIIKIRVFRDTDTGTSDIRFLPSIVGVSYE